MPKKLIETALPLDAINAASMREKSIRHGHPSTLHLWWARRPLAAARAVLWASLVDDPSAHPEQFPTEELQDKERERLFRILEKLVVWENSKDEEVLKEAKIEILRSMGPDPIEFLDPFSGGGSIPLEAQRLGLIAHAHDLNPVAVLINKAMIEIPAKFANEGPVNPGSRKKLSGDTAYVGAVGLSEDIAYYGQWMKEEAFRRIGHLYPTVTLADGTEATVIAWIWARTVKCPNPACGREVPLCHSLDLSKKKGNEHHAVPTYDANGQLHFHVEEGTSPAPGTVNRNGATCPYCGSPIEFPYIRDEGKAGRFGSALISVVAEGSRGRSYSAPNAKQEKSAITAPPATAPHLPMPEHALSFRVQLYGMDDYEDLFSNRQLTALTTFSDLVAEAKRKAAEDATAAGVTTPEEYGNAVATYLAILIDKMADYHSSLCSWHTGRQTVRNTFSRQALPMVWDYSEANPFSGSTGSFDSTLQWVVKSVALFPAGPFGTAEQLNAQGGCDLRNVVISTDPPYYDNIGYADLSDFFYLWLRRSLKSVYPELFRRMMVPKDEELIATPYRHDGSKSEAKSFFENGMLEACRRMYEEARSDIPVTIYYAYKQQDQKDTAGTESSSGWETMLSAVITAGFQITGTWPMRTEMVNRSVGWNTNALASSVVLVCRKRPTDAGVVSRQEFQHELEKEMRPALQALQSSNIAPVDMAQSAIGPGISVYSRYSKVLRADGTPVTVRDALQMINLQLDKYLSDQGQNLDSDARVCLDIYSQFGWQPMPFGEVDGIARAKNTSVADLEHQKLVQAEKGKVRLLQRNEIPHEPHDSDSMWLLAQQLTWAMEDGGNMAVAQIVANPECKHALDAKELVYRLYTIAEKKGWGADAIAYNNLVMAWPEVQEIAANLHKEQDRVQSSLFKQGMPGGR